jgi:DNA invertase Pin-like site-specific DNA recombinase
LNQEYKVGIYIRLSKEDNDKIKKDESESIKNQRQLIYKYLEENHLNNCREYIDDGYSGTNFNRPSFIRLLHDIEKNEINMVITKDLSRLGRDYIKTGYYIEEYFPIKKVRYISILDGIDTYKNIISNDIAPFKALFNDMVSKDTSKKIRSILKNKKEQGLFLGSKAPYGYQKSKQDKHKLIINEDESKVVKYIFKMALEGKSDLLIAKTLDSSGIPSPNKGVWSTSSIYNILKNKEYTGCTISNVWTSISYKNKKRVKRLPYEWIIINNTHPKIIDEDVFELVNSKKRLKRKKNQYYSKELLLKGLIYCSECGSRASASFIKKRNYYVLNCNRYKKDSSSCTSHYIRYDYLERVVLNDIKTKFQIEELNLDIANKISKILLNKNKEISIIYK